MSTTPWPEHHATCFLTDPTGRITRVKVSTAATGQGVPHVLDDDQLSAWTTRTLRPAAPHDEDPVKTVVLLVPLTGPMGIVELSVALKRLHRLLAGDHPLLEIEAIGWREVPAGTTTHATHVARVATEQFADGVLRHTRAGVELMTTD